MTIYDMYGDRDLLARHFPNMERFVEFCRKRSQDNLLPPKEFHCFGDWLSINANTPNEVIAQAYFAESTRLVARAASILGQVEKAKKYEELHAKIRLAFLNNYVTDDGKVRGETQCGYVLALAFDLLDANRTKLAEKHLVDDIEKRGWHLSTGFVGTRDIMQVLAKIGRYDVAFRLLHNTTFPSWGFTIVNGATSIWERWDGWTPEKGFQDPGMNSFAHYAYGAVVGWMFKEIGGISPASPGFSKVRIAPQFDPNLAWAKCSYNSIRGLIRTEWKRTGKSIEITVEVPPNATAEVFLPGEPFSKNVGSGVWVYRVAN
jgi:alpha-L-rhamnosidase